MIIQVKAQTPVGICQKLSFWTNTLTDGRLRSVLTKWLPFRRRHFQTILLNENAWISIKISLKFVPEGPINTPALVQIMAWCRSGKKPLSEPMMVRLPTHICVTRPQRVKCNWLFRSKCILHHNTRLPTSIIWPVMYHKCPCLHPHMYEKSKLCQVSSFQKYI